ncbi:MAG: hypothetical protein J5I50_03340 [Chitinophagaceae bacterium]|nr:hypothetical protein [Chitinophagaceae bacterium]
MRNKVRNILIGILAMGIWGAILLIKGAPQEKYMPFFLMSLVGLGFLIAGLIIIRLSQKKRR